VGIQNVAKDGTRLRYENEQEYAVGRREVSLRSVGLSDKYMDTEEASKLLRRLKSWVRSKGEEFLGAQDVPGFGVLYDRATVLKLTQTAPNPTDFFTELGALKRVRSATILAKFEADGVVSPNVFCGDKYFSIKELEQGIADFIKSGGKLPPKNGTRSGARELVDSRIEEANSRLDRLPNTTGRVLARLPAQFETDPLTVQGFLKITGIDKKEFDGLIAIGVIEVQRVKETSRSRLISSNICDVCQKFFSNSLGIVSRELHARGLYPGQLELGMFVETNLAQITKPDGSFILRDLRKVPGKLAQMEKEYPTPLLDMTLEAQKLTSNGAAMEHLPEAGKKRGSVDSPIVAIISSALKLRRIMASSY
jgi:hypothetical protein